MAQVERAVAKAREWDAERQLGREEGELIDPDEEEEEQEAEDEGDERKGKMKRACKVTQPSKEEREAHEMAQCHTPYRSWCRRCVRGRARGDSHKKVEGGNETEVDNVEMGDCFWERRTRRLERC